MLTAAAIFAATYLVVALGRAPGIRLDRTGAAVVGAALKSLAASVAMIAWFFAGANVSMVAFTAGAALLLTRRVKPEKVFLEINSMRSTPGKLTGWPLSPRPSPCCRTWSPTYRR